MKRLSSRVEQMPFLQPLYYWRPHYVAASKQYLTSKQSISKYIKATLSQPHRLKVSFRLIYFFQEPCKKTKISFSLNTVCLRT